MVQQTLIPRKQIMQHHPAGSLDRHMTQAQDPKHTVDRRNKPRGTLTNHFYRKSYLDVIADSGKLLLKAIGMAHRFEEVFQQSSVFHPDIGQLLLRLNSV